MSAELVLLATAVEAVLLFVTIPHLLESQISFLTHTFTLFLNPLDIPLRMQLNCKQTKANVNERQEQRE